MATEGKTKKAKSGWPNTPAKWIKLLGIPLTILVAAFTLLFSVIQFNEQQAANNTLQKESANMQATQIAVSVTQTVDQQQQTTLDTYLDRMSDLLLMDHLAHNPNAEVQALAVARTLTAVRDLDGTRKGTLIRFLWEAGLINGQQQIISLLGASLYGINMIDADLSGINLSGANLGCIDEGGGQKVCADLSLDALCGTDQVGKTVCADLSGADLSGANLSGDILGCIDEGGQKVCTNRLDASLSSADLFKANLSSANLSGADLSGDDLRLVTLRGAIFGCTIISSQAICTNMGGVDLRGADLRGDNLSLLFLGCIDEGGGHHVCADLSGAKLSGAFLGCSNLGGDHYVCADLSGADLSGADLSGADLSSADLSGARVTNEQLQQAKSLKGATMPDGSIHP